MNHIIAIAALLAAATASADQQTITRFKAAGLEAEMPARMRPKDYGMAPLLCSGTRFQIPSLGEGAGGRVFVCDQPGQTQKIAGYYTALSDLSAAFFSWVFIKGQRVVQINGEMDEATAHRYRDAL